MKKLFISFVAVICGFVMLGMNVTPVAAQTAGLGPWGDIDGPYTWQINGKGWTVYTQNGYSWVYDDYGNRTYLDAYGNRLDGVTAAAAKTITQYSLTYYTTYNGITVYKNPDGKLYTVGSDGILHLYGTEPAPAPAPAPAPSVNNYTFYYSFTSPNGYNVYTDGYGNTWWFAQGGIPQRWTYGYPEGSYWKPGINNYTYYYSYRSADGYYIYRDDYNNYWWFGSDGTPHLVKQGSGGQGGDKPAPAPTPAPSSDVDFNHKNVMEADGIQYTAYVGQYWVAPKTVSWAPEGMHLIGWDYAANTGYVRWKPGAFIKNTGSNLYLYAVYSR